MDGYLDGEVVLTPFFPSKVIKKNYIAANELVRRARLLLYVCICP